MRCRDGEAKPFLIVEYRKELMSGRCEGITAAQSWPEGRFWFGEGEGTEKADRGIAQVRRVWGRDRLKTAAANILEYEFNLSTIGDRERNLSVVIICCFVWLLAESRVVGGEGEADLPLHVSSNIYYV
jgi:hypothetical protein